MKKVAFLLFVLLMIACKKEEPIKESDTKASTSEQLGQEIFDGKGNCAACHQVSQKIIGPSIQEIAKIYKDKNASIVTFLKGDGEPLVDPSQYEVMKTNFAITKTMSEQELKALEAYFYSNLK